MVSFSGVIIILFRNRNPYQKIAEAYLTEQCGFEVVLLDKASGDDMASVFFGPGIKLCTMHSAKGLEFKVVFIVGASDDLAPFFYGGEENAPTEERVAHIEEERRLLYVAVTRARDYLYITVPRGKKPSRFLRAVPEDILCRL